MIKCAHLHFFLFELFGVLEFVLDFLQPLVAVLLRLLGLLDLLIELLALILKLADLFGKSVVGRALQTRPDVFQLVNLQLVLGKKISKLY